MARKKPTTSDLTEQSVALAEFCAKALVAAEQLAIKQKIVDGFSLDDFERTIVADLPAITSTLKTKLARKDGRLHGGRYRQHRHGVGRIAPRRRTAATAQTPLHCQEADGLPASKRGFRRASRGPEVRQTGLSTFQFKITLMELNPPVWRRIQVKDCTLDKLHEHIQTAMGWTNSHLHQFEINGKRYGDPQNLGRRV